MITRKSLFFIFLSLFFYSVLYGVDSGHEPGQQTNLAIKTPSTGTAPENNASETTHREFPTFHPLVVHFPIVLILAALPFYVLGMIRNKLLLRRSGIVLAAFGFLGALLAGYIFHPHTIGLKPDADSVLSSHDFFASLTLYLIGISVALGALTCTSRSKNVTLQAAVAGFLLLSAVTVSFAGHYGAMLVHIHGVGPQGRFLVTEHIDLHIPGFGR